jgi:glutamyl-tRNA synthetase
VDLTPIQTVGKTWYLQKICQELVTKGKAYLYLFTGKINQNAGKSTGEKQIPKYDRLCLSNQNEIIKQIKEKNLSHVIRLLIPNGQII